MPNFVELSEWPSDLRDPAVIAAFAVSRRGGRLPFRTLTYLIDEWRPTLLARTDLEDIFDLTMVRPETRFEGDTRVIDWPQVNIYWARPEGSSRDLLLLLGREPNFHWRGFSETLARYLDSHGAKTILTLRAFPGDVPHTRPAPVVMNGIDAELAARFGAQPSGTRYQGPTDFASVLSSQLQGLGWTTVDLSVTQPHYFPRMPNMAASIALIRAIDHSFGVSTSLDSIQKTADAQHAALDQEMQQSDELRTLLRDLEERYETTFAAGQGTQPGSEPGGNLPTAEEVLRGIEDIFKGSGESQG